MNKILVLTFLLLKMLCGNFFYAQQIKTISSVAPIQFIINNGMPQKIDKKNNITLQKGLTTDICYTLDDYFKSKKYRTRNLLHVKQTNVMFYIDGTDSLKTTICAITFNEPVIIKRMHEFEKVGYPPSIMPQERYLLAKNDSSVLLVSIFSNISMPSNETDYIHKKKRLEYVLDWIRKNYTATRASLP